MQHAQREMRSQGENMGEDCMEEEEDKLHREPETTVEDTEGQVYPVKIKQVQGETQMQWMWTIAGKDRRRER